MCNQKLFWLILNLLFIPASLIGYFFFYVPHKNEQVCAKIGERSVSNIDLSTGKANPDIKAKYCCSELKNIADKQPSTNKQGTCAVVTGTHYNLCSPCGNGVCDTQYEDSCNCPEDCK